LDLPLFVNLVKPGNLETGRQWIPLISHGFKRPTDLYQSPMTTGAIGQAALLRLRIRLPCGAALPA